jgi:hypothetical protein
MASEIAVLRAALKASPEAHDKLRAMALSGKLGTMDVPNCEPLVIVCAPNHYGIEGAKQAKCECGVIVWMTLSTIEMLIRRDAAPHAPNRIICTDCFHKELREEARAQARPQ